MGALTERFQAMPRAMRWLVGAGLFVILFFTWDSTAGRIVKSWNAQSDEIESHVALVNRADEVKRDLGSLDDAILGLGPVRPLVREAEGRASLMRVVNEVLKEHTLSDDDFDLTRESERLPTHVGQGITRGDRRAGRLSGTLRFEAKPEEAIAVIADLEKCPDIASVSSVRINKTDSRSEAKVKVTLVIETWIEVAASGRRRS